MDRVRGPSETPQAKLRDSVSLDTRREGFASITGRGMSAASVKSRRAKLRDDNLPVFVKQVYVFEIEVETRDLPDAYPLEPT